MGNRSLDDFLDSGDDADGVSDDGPEGDDSRVDPATVEPAETTYAWSANRGVCESCGEAADRRWRSDDGLVCPDCKEW